METEGSPLPHNTASSSRHGSDQVAPVHPSLHSLDATPQSAALVEGHSEARRAANVPFDHDGIGTPVDAPVHCVARAPMPTAILHWPSRRGRNATSASRGGNALLLQATAMTFDTCPPSQPTDPKLRGPLGVHRQLSCWREQHRRPVDVPGVEGVARRIQETRDEETKKRLPRFESEKTGTCHCQPLDYFLMETVRPFWAMAEPVRGPARGQGWSPPHPPTRTHPLFTHTASSLASLAREPCPCARVNNVIREEAGVVLEPKSLCTKKKWPKSISPFVNFSFSTMKSGCRGWGGGGPLGLSAVLLHPCIWGRGAMRSAVVTKAHLHVLPLLQHGISEHVFHAAAHELPVLPHLQHDTAEGAKAKGRGVQRDPLGTSSCSATWGGDVCSVLVRDSPPLPALRAQLVAKVNSYRPYIWWRRRHPNFFFHSPFPRGTPPCPGVGAWMGGTPPCPRGLDLN